MASTKCHTRSSGPTDQNLEWYIDTRAPKSGRSFTRPQSYMRLVTLNECPISALTSRVSAEYYEQLASFGKRLLCKGLRTNLSIKEIFLFTACPKAVVYVQF